MYDYGGRTLARDSPFYQMNDKQIKIADRLLHILYEHGGRANKTGVRELLNKEFKERTDTIDITYVFELLENDYELIAPMGEAWIRLTPEGQTMVKRGMKRYRQKLSLKEQFKEAKELIALIVSIFAILEVLFRFLI